MLSNLLVHIAADSSLFKISLKRLNKRLIEISLALAAIGITAWNMIETISSTFPVLVYIFMTFIIMGFLAAEVIEMEREEEEED